jgi:cell division protein FtsQ
MSIDQRLVERRKTVAEDNAKRNVGRLLKFLFAVVVVGAGVWVVFSPWLSVKQVVATGIETSDANSVLADNRVRAGTPMILIDAQGVESRILQDPWVADASVRRDWPDTVFVDVVERAPIAWVRTEGGWTRRAVDGVALPSEPEPDGELARIEMPHLPDDDARSSIELTGALEFALALPADLHPGCSITFQDGELWATVAGFQVRLGRSDDMTEKALSLAALLEKRHPEGSIINLIAPTNPSVKEPSTDDTDDVDTSEPGNDNGNDQNDDS